VNARFTKKADGRHRLTVVRDDGSASQGQMVPGLGADAIPHDLLHALVEKALGFTRGVYGMVGTGLEIGALGALADPKRKAMNRDEPELMLSEIVTTLLQAESAYEGVEAREFREQLRGKCEEHGIAVRAIADEELSAVRGLREEYARRWRGLGVGETIEVEL
jgi:hypothetical protein